MTYQYRARDPNGNTFSGTLEADSIDLATEQLRQDGLQILVLEEDDTDTGLFPRRVSKKDIVYTTGQLAIMVDTGITLSSALAGIIAQEENTTLRKILTELKNAVEAGEDFSSALARHPKHFDLTYISLVRAAESTGALGPMLQRIANYLRREVETRSKVRAAMAYPSVMMVMAIGVTIFLLTYVLPKFTPLFASRGTTLPKPTLVMMSVSSVVLGYWYLWLAGTAALVAAFLVGKRTAPGRQALDWLKINVPILGPMFRKVIISRSVRTLGTMLSSGVPMIDSIKLCAEIAGNYYYQQLWMEVLDQVTTGKRISDVLGRTDLMPRVLAQMVSAGEESGKLDVVLERVSVYYDQEVETALKTATSLIEPIMIAFMGVVVGGIGLALLLPIFSLSRHP